MVVVGGQKRGVSFNENVTINQPDTTTDDVTADKKYSLDSDEEEEVRKLKKLLNCLFDFSTENLFSIYW